MQSRTRSGSFFPEIAVKISIPYAEDYIEIELPESRLQAVLEPKAASCGSDAGNEAGSEVGSTAGRTSAARGAGSARPAIVKAAEHAGWAGFIEGGGPLLVIVNDATRPTPTAEILSALGPGLLGGDVSFIVATGAHRAPDEAELKSIFGPLLPEIRDRIFSHDARRSECLYAGTTSAGTEVYFNKKAFDASRILIIGSIEPHYFAGFTGGRKGLLPGIAAYSSIERNHSLALSPDASIMKLEGNPVHEDMAEACRMLDKRIFTIMSVLDRSQRIHSLCAGGLEDAFGRAAAAAAEVYSVPVEAPAGIIIASARYPMDIDLYQSQKAVENAAAALEDGGILILVSSCRDGVGDDSFFRLLSSCSTPEAVYEKIAAGYRLGYHKAAKLADILSRAEITAVTGLAPEILESVFITPASDLQAAVDDALRRNPGKILVMSDASVTLPRLPEKV